jgi:hypothetical protein
VKKLEGSPGGDRRKVALETVVRATTVASCEWLAGEAENGERRERQSDLEKNRMEKPDEEVAQNARRIYIAAETN